MIRCVDFPGRITRNRRYRKCVRNLGNLVIAELIAMLYELEKKHPPIVETELVASGLIMITLVHNEYSADSTVIFLENVSGMPE